ncbi:hypothetical protein EYF80_008374 [Liparis tanakae]|uniref:Uncharacterized protein n=1 Tax=Liparis tanakae TaxID=230148 RepID=A0A4Z2IUX3_9TELE|nr:hypothetical protein EYF80_008374 [Liparis tanakae]
MRSFREELLLRLFSSARSELWKEDGSSSPGGHLDLQGRPEDTPSVTGLRASVPEGPSSAGGGQATLSLRFSASFSVDSSFSPDLPCVCTRVSSKAVRSSKVCQLRPVHPALLFTFGCFWHCCWLHDRTGCELTSLIGLFNGGQDSGIGAGLARAGGLVRAGGLLRVLDWLGGGTEEGFA